MREIKFRAWDDYTKTMLTWEQIKSGCEMDFFDLISFKKMQYIGLKDKNDKEIYEGDIVKCAADFIDEIAAVVYEPNGHYPAFEMEPFPDVECNGFSYFMNEGTVEVIGNIYENPELLKG